jgi:deoxyribonuclease-4
MIIGAHVSVAGGIENAVSNARQLGCETFQVFTKNQNQWREKVFDDGEIGRFRQSLANAGYTRVPLASHDSYLINLCSPDSDKLDRSRQAFLAEINRCEQLGIAFLIFHPGSHMGRGESWGIRMIAESLDRVISDSENSPVELLLETTAGQGTNLGFTFEQIRAIIDRVTLQERIGVCVDTCHIFAAGYDVRTDLLYEETLRKMEQTFGLHRIRAFHLNDSKKELGSRVDRHERPGRGFIGESVFRRLISDERFASTPGYLEIPGGEQAFMEDIGLLKSFRVS